MTEIHPLGIVAQDRKNIEAVGEHFIREGLYHAQKKSWEVFHQIKDSLKAGLTEIEGQKLALELFAKAGVTAHWHRPQIRFGSGTALTYYEPLRSDYHLSDGDLVYFDLGPVWKDEKNGISYEGDVGDTFVFGQNPEGEKLVSASHQLFQEGVQYWKTQKCTGVELYQFLTKRASEWGYSLIEKIDGHRVSDYPHTKYTKQRLSDFHFIPTDALWVLEFQLLHPCEKMGAFFEDLLI